MENYEMNDNTKLEIAIEILATKIANISNKGYSVNDKEMQILLNEREKLYSGNKEVLNKIIDVYGPEIKKNYENVGSNE